MKVLRLLVLISIAQVSGCVTDEADRYYATERYPPCEVKKVEVLHCAPARSYDVIADIQARGADEKYIQKRAAEIGADAVIIGKYGGLRSRGDKWASEDKYGSSYTRITGTAIKYKLKE